MEGHRLSIRLRRSRSNTSTEYSLPGATQLSKPFVLLSELGAGERASTDDGLCPHCADRTQSLLADPYNTVHRFYPIGRNEKNFDLIISVLGEHARATGVFSWPVPTRPLSPAAATRAGCCRTWILVGPPLEVLESTRRALRALSARHLE